MILLRYYKNHMTMILKIVYLVNISFMFFLKHTNLDINPLSIKCIDFNIGLQLLYK